MLDALHIHRFQARHRVADAAGRRRALAAQQQLLDGELEAALSRVVASDEVVLLRRLSASLHLRAGATDRDNARDWSDALALGLARALQHAGPRELQRFAHRRQALQAFIADALQGQETRDWAWQQLSLLPTTSDRRNAGGQRRAALLRLLADDAEVGVPLLRGLLGGPLWLALMAQLEDRELSGLTLSVLARLAGPGSPGFADGAGASADWTAAADFVSRSAAIADSTPAAAATTPDWLLATARAAQTPLRARWALRLACMLALPSLGHRGAAAVDAQLWAWAVPAAAAEPVLSAAAAAAAASPVFALRAPL